MTTRTKFKFVVNVNYFILMWLLNLLMLCVAAKNLTNDIENMMMDGNPTNDNNHLYNVGIFRKSTSEYKCSGVIFTKQAVLSAAFCLINNKPGEYTILAGTFNLNSGGKMYDVNRIVLQNIGYDSIAILFVASNIEPPTQVNYIQLPTQDDPIAGGSSSYIFGWMTNVVSTFLL